MPAIQSFTGHTYDEIPALRSAPSFPYRASYPRKHLRNVPGSAPTMFIKLNLGISCLCFPEWCHSLRGRNILVLEESVVVQGNLRAGTT
jgi:hypothetical protein